MKRVKRNAVANRVNKLAKITIIVSILGLIGTSGWLMARSHTPSRIHQAGREKLSVLVDRIDELSQAWKRRSVPEPKPQPPLQNQSSPSDQLLIQKKQQLSAGEKPKPERPSPTAPSANQPASTHDEVSPEDQQQLRGLFRELGKKP